MKIITTIITLTVTLTASASVPLPWTVETSRVQPANFDAFHGEALEFIARFNSLGKPLALDSHMATLYYQTNGMDQAWWSVPASVSGNVARATFTPAMDPRANKIVVFIGVSAGPSNLNYRATANVRFLNSPGANPGWIEPPVVKLDFSQIETLNAPWFTKDESNGRYYTKTETDTKIASATNGLESAAHAAQTYLTRDSTLSWDYGYIGAEDWDVWLYAEKPVLFRSELCIGSWNDIVTEDGADYPTVTERLPAYIARLASAVTNGIPEAISAKQNTISDLATIRSGAAAGATALQSYAETDPSVYPWAKAATKPSYGWTEITGKPNLSTVATSGAYSDLSGRPAIPTDATIEGWGYLKSYTETDPTVPSWAKATSKPSYTWSEIGSKPSWIGSSKPSYTWSEIGSRPTIPTDSTVSGWGYLKTESDPTVAATIAPIETTVNAWQTYWDGDDVRVTVTNYYGSQDLPSLYLEQKISEGGTNYFKTIWTEKARLNVILDRLAQLEADVDTKADRAWGFYDSHTGEYAPDGFTSISSGAILVSKDMSYQKTVTTGGGEVWVLTANDPTVITGTETNGFFKIADSEGNSIFEVVKGDKRVVPATTSAVAAGNNSLTITYNVVSQEHPSIEICDDLGEQDWKAEDDAGCPATVVWGGSSGAYVATVTGRQAMSKMFVKGTYEIGGETYIRNGAPVAFEKVILGGVTYRVTVETVNNKKLMVLTEL